jgi:hypothetical protein
MLQTSSEALRDDPVMKMLQTFCEITSLDIRGFIKVVTVQNFAETLNKMAVEVNASYIVVPWAGSGSLVDDTTTPVQELFLELRRQQSMHTPIQHFNFMQDLLSTAESSVLILIDRGLDMGNSKKNRASIHVERLVPFYQRIFLPFFGGEDDRQALEIVLGISNQKSVVINIVRFKPVSTRVNNHYSSESELMTVGSDVEIMSCPAPQFFLGDISDDVIIAEHFGTLERREKYINVTFNEVETNSPLSSALKYTNDLSSRDLIVVGRGVASSSFQNPMDMRGADADRRKTLGNAAESIMLSACTASVLVVQGKKIKP